jgi:ketosteroid isomerase-like protein
MTLRSLLGCVTAGTACLASVACLRGPAGTATLDSKSPLAAVAETWIARYNGGDAAGVAALYTTDGYYASAHVLAHGREEIARYWERGIAAGGHVDFIQPVEIVVSGDIGYLLGRYQATNAGITVDGRILIVARRLQGRWLIAAHETVVRDQPE